MSTEEEKQTDALEEIKESTEESSAILQKFGDVFSSINASIMHQSRIMGEMLRLQSEQFEIERRREQLESVSSAPEPVIPQSVVTLPDSNSTKPTNVDDKRVSNLRFRRSNTCGAEPARKLSDSRLQGYCDSALRKKTVETLYDESLIITLAILIVNFVTNIGHSLKEILNSLDSFWFKTVNEFVDLLLSRFTKIIHFVFAYELIKAVDHDVVFDCVLT
jgi:hypothetical protein